jgi:hypothetical protein
MPLYTIIAKRETLYEFNFEADSEEEAIGFITTYSLQQMERLKLINPRLSWKLCPQKVQRLDSCS